ncbi:hypothetical protein QBC39DRAFT_299898 [Podospora conica]|nr:hypothetical protein QBC39DRAFT_299898 [Schizothecium conicum]
MTRPFNFTSYRQAGIAIRSASTKRQCFGNLSLALGSIGPIASASSSGASGAMTLLPTAGALIGAPAKELWILYKLVPIAGVLSMLLSLGGNIVPNTAGEYELEGYNYGGVIATAGGKDDDVDASILSVKHVDPATFAQVVKARAENPLGSNKRTTVTIGVLFQLFWIVVIIFSCWFTGVGAVVAWWCQGWGWMLAWYLVLAISSLLENYALVPFSRQWTMRVSMAPAGIEISENAPMAFPPSIPGDKQPFTTSDSKPEPSEIEMTLLQERTATERSERSIPWASNHHSFLVIISVSGISRGRAALRVFSKAWAVGCFAAGTAAFASTSLITITVAMSVIALILGAGVFGRVASMWMVSEMMKDNPVIHRVVESEVKAEQFIQELFSTQGLVIELMGHVFVNGRCVERYSQWWNWSTIFGVLVSRCNIEKLLSRRY